VQIIGADRLETLFDYPALIEALRGMFRDGCASPTRHHHSVDVPGGAPGTLLLMPAWQAGGMMGVKTVTIFAGNARHGLPSVLGQYYLMDAASGEPLALIEGTVLIPTSGDNDPYGSRRRPQRRLAKAFGRRRARLAMCRIATPHAPGRKPWKAVPQEISVSHYHRSLV
jgi:hypothetical protein